MSAVGLEVLDHTVQITHIWINALEKRLKWKDKARTYHLLKAVLQALRDSLPPHAAANLAAQLPTLLRGAFYERWRPTKIPAKPLPQATFLARLLPALDGTSVRPADAASTVFRVLSEMIAVGEIEKVCLALPADVRALWISPARAA